MRGTGANRVGDRVAERLWPLQHQALCAQAQRRTGLKDFGDPPVQPAVSVLTTSLEREANLHPLGRFLMRSHLRGLLETRLRLTARWNEQNGVLNHSPVHKPVFITGMPRSGSTFLHELLAEDPDNRVPRVWEVMFPMAGPEPGPRERQRRVRKAAVCLWWFRRLAPHSQEVHPLQPWTPQECVAIQSYSLLSEEFITLCRVPGYETFLHSADLRPAYAFQRRFLQHLQAACPARWILKSPDHVFGLEHLFAVFPDARVIQTHRNPMEVLRSLNRLNDVLRGVFVRPIDRTRSEAHESQSLAQSVERLIRFRDTHPELTDRFLDVSYTEFVAAPLETVRRLYRHLEIPWTDGAAERMQQLVAARSRYAQPRNRSAAAASPPAHAEARRFANYCARFQIPC